MFDVHKLMDQEELSVDDDNETLIEKLIAAKRILIADYRVVTTIESLEAEEGGYKSRPSRLLERTASSIRRCQENQQPPPCRIGS